MPFIAAIQTQGGKKIQCDEWKINLIQQNNLEWKDLAPFSFVASTAARFRRPGWQP